MTKFRRIALMLVLACSLASCRANTPEHAAENCREAESYRAEYLACVRSSVDDHKAVMAGKYTRKEIALMSVSDCNGTLRLYDSSDAGCLWKGGILPGHPQVSLLQSVDLSKADSQKLWAKAVKEAELRAK